MSVEGLDDLSGLNQYLLNANPEVRSIGAQIALSLTATEEGRRGLVQAETLPALCRLSGDTDKVAEPAVSALINLCADELPNVVEELLRRGIVDRLMETLTSDECSFRNRALMLLANVSARTRGAKKMMQVPEEEDEEGANEEQGEEEERNNPTSSTSVEGEEPAAGREKKAPTTNSTSSSNSNKTSNPAVLTGLHVRRLLRWFLSQYDALAEEDEWQHVASVLHNVSQLQAGRDMLRRRQTDLLPALLPQLESRNPVRRHGISHAIRNCCFEEGDHYWLIHELNIIPHLLYPFSGPEETLDAEDRIAGPEGTLDAEEGLDPFILKDGNEKKREPDPAIRAALLETILLFCSTRASREALRKRGVYPILREADYDEKNEENSEIIYKIVNFLQRDESPSTANGTGNKLLQAKGGWRNAEDLNEMEDPVLPDDGSLLPTPISDLKDRQKELLRAREEAEKSYLDEMD